MDYVYILLSFLTSIGIILLICSFWEDFKKLNSFQKISLLIVYIAGLSPIVIGTIQGFLSK